MYFISFVKLNYFHLTILGGATSILCGDDSSSKKAVHSICSHGFKLAGLLYIVLCCRI